MLITYARMQPQALGFGELVAEIAADPQALAGVPRACLVAIEHLVPVFTGDARPYDGIVTAYQLD